MRRFVTLLVLAAGLSFVWLSNLFGFLLTVLQIGSAPLSEGGLRLNEYAVALEAQEVEGIRDNLSGLTYHHGRNTLFAAINRPQEVIELSRDGAVLRRIPIRDTFDVEGIAHVRDDWFILSDEGSGKIIWVEILPNTKVIDTRKAQFLQFDPLFFKNMGFEGLSWDDAERAMYIGNEMLPVRVLRVDGLDPVMSSEGLKVSVNEWKPAGVLGHALADISSLTVRDGSGHILFLSHLSGSLIEYDSSGQPLSLMLLWKGRHGLHKSVPQAEGVAIGDNGSLYIVSEPNLFYRFERR